jgi:sulfite reductase alpha subunit-like flavoprotein
MSVCLSVCQVDAALAKLGAARVVPLGLGDDDGTLEEDFEAWKEGLLPALVAKFHPSAAAAAADDDDLSTEIPELPFKLKVVPAVKVGREQQLRSQLNP